MGRSGRRRSVEGVAPQGRAARDRRVEDEPRPEGDDWVESGGELIWAAGFTEGGAPYGLTLDEYRQTNEQGEARAGWARAKAVLREALGPVHGPHLEEAIGWVRFLGEGLSYRVHEAECLLRAVRGEEPRDLVVRLPRSDAPWDVGALARREIRVLEHLMGVGVPLRLPRLVAAVPVAEGLALVQEKVHGVRLDLRSGRQRAVRPWEVVAEAASVCHRVDATPLHQSLPCHPTRRDHALARLRILDDLGFPEARDARQWAIEHLPPETPSRLVHGDLLGQNLLLGVEGEPLGVIDWEHAEIGDPAYDLAIVTRGVRRPFQLDGGMHKLLDAYNARVEVGLGAADVHLYELCLMAGFYLQECRRHREGSPAVESWRRGFCNLLRRVEAG